MKGCGLGVSSSTGELVPRGVVQQHLHSHFVSIGGSVVKGSEARAVRDERGSSTEVTEEVSHHAGREGGRGEGGT